MSDMKLAFAPYFDENPYQAQLSEKLEASGILVNGIDFSKFTVIDFLRNGVSILHLHWLSGFFIRKKTWKAYLALLRVIVKLFLLKLLGIRLVWTVHNLKDHENPYPRLDRACNLLVAKIADAVIVHCEDAKSKILESYNLSKDEKKVFVVPHGSYVGIYENRISRLEARKTLKIDNSKIVFLFLGKIRPYKGIFELINVWKQLDLEEAELIIAGEPVDGTMGNKIEREIADSKGIRYVSGFIADTQIQTYMNVCDIVVFPYRDILTSGAVILAMSFGKPCIAPRKGCIGELLDDLGSFTYDSAQCDGLLYAMQSAVSQGKSLSKMGEHNLSLVKKLGWMGIADETLKIYQWCCNKYL